MRGSKVGLIDGEVVRHCRQSYQGSQGRHGRFRPCQGTWALVQPGSCLLGRLPNGNNADSEVCNV